jgi:hypothetical protein
MPKQKQEKKTPEQQIEELALMVGRGFAETATKADIQVIAADVRGGFAAADQRLDRIELNTAGLSRRLDVVEERVLQLARKIGLDLK